MYSRHDKIGARLICPKLEKMAKKDAKQTMIINKQP
jgi:hypothetical protein